MARNELLDLVRRTAREQLDEILNSAFYVRLADGTEKSATELTEEEFASLEPQMKQLWAWWWVYRHRMAERGYIHIGDGEFKHIDHLTLEDVPRLRALEAEELRQQEATMNLVGSVVEGIQDLQEIGVDVDWAEDETVGDWLRKDQD